MTLHELASWHEKQAVRFRSLSQDEQSNLPQPYKQSRRRSLGRQAEFHSNAARAIRAITGDVR
ncbi:hypothetical protein [Burkholderia cenocepacia]|uniref:hypothetical protein n=1 Tax=Burkholderia cenocepacia TaxID=95486 RepID=UPI000A90B91B|nr:hypothetical protein [Burkholderia cenocepacia]